MHVPSIGICPKDDERLSPLLDREGIDTDGEVPGSRSVFSTGSKDTSSEMWRVRGIWNNLASSTD